ncbi:MAG: ATP-binding protein [Candidatus Nanopelagicales bacterium]|nr:ATP-binding protein [Candidatus Nanopelagicales bacterium]
MYLNPSTPVWRPKSEEDLTAAIEDGRLEENHFVEVKSALAPGKSGNRELAKDLAQFAIDGGTLIIGVSEDKERDTLALAPIPDTSGLPERVEDVARTRIEPPLSVRFDLIRSGHEDGAGYLFVHVPPSPHAPHMVEGRYYARAEKTKRTLTDSEVLRLHQARLARQREPLVLLDAAIERDPIPEGQEAHYFFVAAPDRPTGPLAEHIIDGPGWQDRFRAVIAAGHRIPGISNEYLPSVAQATALDDRGDGRAAHSGELRPGRLLNEEYKAPESLVEVEIADTGEIRCFAGTVSQHRPVQYGLPETEQVLYEFIPLHLTRQLLQVTVALAHATGYLGAWHVGVAVTGIAGVRINPQRQHFLRDDERYDAHQDTYRQTCAVTLEQLERRPGEVTRTLLQRFLRACGRSGTHDTTYLHDPDLPGDVEHQSQDT